MHSVDIFNFNNAYGSTLLRRSIALSHPISRLVGRYYSYIIATFFQSQVLPLTRQYYGDNAVPITGECFCGEVSYSVSGALRDARSCHCSRCRKAFSSQASAYALVEPDEFFWLTGEAYLTSYVGEHGFGLQFCRQCGSTLCGIFNGVVHGVTLGCLNDDPSIEIGRHIFAGSKAAWEILPEGVVIYQEGEPE